MPMQIFAIFRLFGDGHSNSCGIIPHYGFNLRFCNDCGGGGLVAKLCPTLLRHHGLQPACLLCPWDFLARKLELVAICSSRGSSPPRGWTGASYISCVGRQILYHWATREAQLTILMHFTKILGYDWWSDFSRVQTVVPQKVNTTVLNPLHCCKPFLLQLNS